MPSAIYLFNTQTRQKELLKPIKAGSVSLYTCGPTVYNYAHIGNFRTYVFEDLLKRSLQFFGYSVTHVMNLTDVDDKTIHGALQQEVSLDAYTQIYKDAFFADIDTLLLRRADHYPAATEYVNTMIDLIHSLLAKQHAYRSTDGSIYYAIHSCPTYGKLSQLKIDQLKIGASERLLNDEYDKEHASDFVLWKKHDPERDQDIFWESPFGPGRPGWHLECSAMAIALLGHTIDIHVGGIDNMFPHHENEIAQSEAYTGHTFVNLWLHSEHLLVDGQKMSKSLGNFYSLRNLLDRGYSGIQIRYFLLQTHYKTPLNFTFDGLQAAGNSLKRLHNFIQRLQEWQIKPNSCDAERIVDELLKEFLNKFSLAIADDLNISVALAALFDCIRVVNSLLDKQKISTLETKKILAYLAQIDEVLGIIFFKVPDVIPAEIIQAMAKRKLARESKDWKLADEMRIFITQKGYTVEDTVAGARLKKM